MTPVEAQPPIAADGTHDELTEPSIRKEVRKRIMTRINVLLLVLFSLFIAGSALTTYAYITLQGSINANARKTAKSIEQHAKIGHLVDCSDINSLRNGLVGSLNEQLARSKRSLDALEANPASSDRQKIVAAANYAGAADFVDRLAKENPSRKCVYPPKLPTSTTTQAPKKH